jgi:hypothetical protein
MCAFFCELSVNKINNFCVSSAFAELEFAPCLTITNDF